MKKLNNREIDALANKIQSELQKIEKARYEKETRVKLNKFYTTKLGKACKLVNEAREAGGYDIISDNYLCKFAGIKPLKHFNMHLIEQSIILAQFEQPDLTTLINAVKAEFK